MIIAVPAETFPGERRVALTPQSLKVLGKLGAEVRIESGAGRAAGYLDADYEQVGAKIVTDRESLFREAEIVVQVRAAAANPTAGLADQARLREGQILIAQCDPLSEPQAMVSLSSRRATVFALELVPRITRAQSMDVRSSMDTVAGYRAVLLAAMHLPQMFPMLMTAAGTLSPAKVFIMGAGVAGLQAISTARRLGAVVQATDVRREVREQVQSLGAKFVDTTAESAEGAGGYARQMDEEYYRKQRELTLGVVRESDVVITTALIPGKPAPRLITEEMVQAMRPGSVIVDLAAERGGNCALTRAGETAVVHGVTIIGPLNISSDVPRDASQMFSNNVTTFLKSLLKGGQVVVDLKDEVVAGMLVCQGGEVRHPRIRELAGLPPLATPPEPAAVKPAEEPPRTIKLVGDEEPSSPPAT